MAVLMLRLTAFCPLAGMSRFELDAACTVMEESQVEGNSPEKDPLPEIRNTAEVLKKRSPSLENEPNTKQSPKGARNSGWESAQSLPSWKRGSERKTEAVWSRSNELESPSMLAQPDVEEANRLGVKKGVS